MPFRVGQRVAAAQTIGALGDIRRGTPGTVVGVSYLGAYDVKFIGGRLVRGLRRDQLIARPPAFGLIGSGCLLWLAAAALLPAALLTAALLAAAVHGWRLAPRSHSLRRDPSYRHRRAEAARRTGMKGTAHEAHHRGGDRRASAASCLTRPSRRATT